MALEGCNLDLSWKCFGQACRISKALGYHSVDETPETPPTATTAQDQNQSARQAEVDKNRKRFEFWHILRTDSLFRMSFGKPNLIPAGSWKVNFPDPSITGVDDDSSRFIQIHFLACMRLALIVMRYLDWLDFGMSGDVDPVQYDHTVDSFINEVQSVLSDWDTVSFILP